MKSINIPNSIRWLLILPAASVAFIGLQLIIALVNSFTPIPEKIIDIFCQFANSLAGPFAFVFVGAKIAPSYKYYISISLAVFYVLFSTVIVYLAIQSQNPADPLWWLITSIILGLLAATIACSVIKAEEFKIIQKE